MNLSLIALSVGGGQEFSPQVGRRRRCPRRSKDFLQVETKGRIVQVSSRGLTQLDRKVWKCLKLTSLRGNSKNKILLQISEGLGLEIFEKLRIGLIGAKTSTREGSDIQRM